MSYAENIHQGKSSNIFNTNTTPIPSTPSKIRDPNKSTNFLSWNDPADKESKKPIRTTANQKSSIFSDAPIQIKPGRNYASRDTLVLGNANEDMSSFNVKREKTKEYDPNKYFKESSAYERRLKQFYGDDEKYKTNNLKSSIGVLGTELHSNDNNQFTEGNARERNYHMLYNSSNANNGTQNNTAMPTTKPKQIMSKSSTNAQYTIGKDGHYNHIESLKSNIFYDDECEKRNKEVYVSKPLEDEPKSKESIDYKETPIKNNKKKAENVFYAKLDWKDPKTSLIYRNKDNMKDTAHDRKLNDLFGSSGTKDSSKLNSNQKSRQGEVDMQLRSDIERHYQTEHPMENESKIKKQMESVSTIIQQDQRDLYDPVKIKKADRQCQQYEVTNFTHFNDVNISKIEQMMRGKGMHIFGTKTDESYHDGKTIGKITFSIRENNDDNKYEAKLNEAKEEIKKETGLEIKPAIQVKRKAATCSMPSTVTWDNAHVEQLIKNKPYDTTHHQKIHSKGGFTSEKVTNSTIDHKYKKK